MSETPAISFPSYRGALCAIPTAKGLLGLDESQIESLVDDGRLVAFDIRTPRAARRELRILTDSIAQQLRMTGSGGSRPTISPAAALARVLGDIGHDRPLLTGVEARQVLNCGGQHLMNLVKCRALPTVRGTRRHPGPGGSPIIARATFAEWLTSRIA